jgi:hypothetical protein
MECVESLAPLRSFVATDVSPITLSVSSPLVVIDFRGMVGSCFVDTPYLSRTPVYILRKRGRRMATEAATIPVPGSAIAHIVALIEVAGIWLVVYALFVYNHKSEAERPHRGCST